MTESDSEAYIAAHCEPLSELLNELERETHIKYVNPRMLTGRVQCALMRMLCRIHRPKRLLELGTFTGFSAIAIGELLSEGAILETVEANPENESIIRRYISKGGLEDRIRLHIGSAIEVIDQLDGEFDWVYIDADKRNYPLYFDRISPRIREGGLLLSDNVLWNGRVTELSGVDPDIDALRTYNRKVFESPDFQSLILPIRDGISVAMKCYQQDNH